VPPRFRPPLGRAYPGPWLNAPWRTHAWSANALATVEGVAVPRAAV
jgi:hypothetical protein